METAIPPTVQTNYLVRYTNDCLLVNDELVNYGKQILALDKLYIIDTGDHSKLKTPIVLDRTREVDELDRKIFFRTFLLEIVKGLEIASFQDTAFILQRVPKHLKYFIGILQKVSLIRWNQLLANDAFFLVLYQTLEQVISKRPISELRISYVEELINAHLKTPYSRIYFLIDTLLLENENLRNTMSNLARQVILKEIDDRKFFEIHLLGKVKIPFNNEESENESMEDNRSDTDSVPEDKEMDFPNQFLTNSINVLKSSQKIKIAKEVVLKKVLNKRFFKILKNFFQTFFESQKNQLLELLALVSEIEPNQMWKITFEEGRSTRCKALLFLELLLTSSMINFQKAPKKPKTTRKTTNHNLTRENKQFEGETERKKSWQFAWVVIEKFITIQTSERKVFLQKIINTQLECKLGHEELDFILNFLQNTAKDSVYFKKNSEIWHTIKAKIESLVTEMQRAKQNKKNEIAESSKKQSPETRALEYPAQSKKLLITSLPFSKSCMIYLLKIFKLLVENERKFKYDLNPYCLMYLVDVTEKKKGVIEGVRAALIDAMAKRESLVAENVMNQSIMDINLETESD